MSSKFDTERLISEVENRKRLWDASHQEYKDRELRLKAWLEITANIVPDFGNLDEVMQKKYVEKVKKRWKTARDAYFKGRNNIGHKKHGSKATKVPKYAYHDQLNFLDRMRESPTESNFNVPQDIESNDDLLQNNESPQRDDPLDAKSTLSIDKNDFRWKRPSRTAIFEDNLWIKLLQGSKEKEEDDDRAFLSSLLPSLRTFNQDQKLMFRSQVLQLVMSIKRSDQPNINMQPPTSQPPQLPMPTTVFQLRPTVTSRRPYQQDFPGEPICQHHLGRQCNKNYTMVAVETSETQIFEKFMQ